MHNNCVNKYLYYTLNIFLVTFLISCSSNKYISNNGEKFDNVASKVMQMAKEGEYKKAENLLLETMKEFKPVKAPFVENNTLIYYSTNSTETMSVMINAAYLSQKIKSGKIDNIKDKEDSILIHSYHDNPWSSSIAIYPSYPKLYFLMGYVYNSMKEHYKAVNYLDTAIYMYNGFGAAWSEKVYTYVLLKQITKAKEIGLEALKNLSVNLDKFSAASIQRKLGWICLEERDFENAEYYYLESLKNDENEIARIELELIKSYKKK